MTKPKLPKRLDDEAYDRHYIPMTYEMGMYMMDHLRRLYREFDGDLSMAIVLGEIGHHNARHFVRDILPRSGTDARTLGTAEVIGKASRPCNALSVAEASGIPRETVRRKVEKLVKLGFVTRDAQGGLHTTRAVAAKFKPFDRHTIEELLALAERVHRLAGKD